MRGLGSFKAAAHGSKASFDIGPFNDRRGNVVLFIAVAGKTNRCLIRVFGQDQRSIDPSRPRALNFSCPQPAGTSHPKP